MTSQADLDMRFNNMAPVSRRVCSRADIKNLIKKIDSSKQVSLNGCFVNFIMMSRWIGLLMPLQIH